MGLFTVFCNNPVLCFTATVNAEGHSLALTVLYVIIIIHVLYINSYSTIV